MFTTLKYQYYVFISLSLAVLVILLATNLSFYFYTGSIIERNMVQNKLQTTQKVQEQLDAMLNEINNISISINASNYIQQVMSHIPMNSTENYFDNNPQTSLEVRDVLYSITGLQPLKGSIVLISKNYDFIDVSNKMDSQMVNKSYIEGLPGIKELLLTNRIGLDHLLVRPHPDRWSASEGEVFSLIRTIRDNFNVYGLIEISYEVEEIQKLFSFLNQQNESNFVIFDKAGNVFLSQLNANLGIDVPSLTQKVGLIADTGNFEVKGSDKTFMATYSHLKNEDLTVAIVEDMSSFKKPINILRNTTISVYLVTMITTLLFLYVYTLGITRPITQLKKSLMDVDVGDLHLAVYNAHSNNEIVMLGKVVSNLLGEIKRHMMLTEQAHQNEVAANMTALQAQINPHFLYNTLSVISAQGLKQGNREVVEMCSALSNMFRYVTKQESSRTTLENEFEHIRNYLLLMGKRYEGFFTYDFEMDNRIRSVSVPKLILQPFIENMFQHAFSTAKPPWYISVKGIWQPDGRWRIEIRDNGTGFDEHMIRRLNQRVEQFKTTGSAIDERLPEEGIGMVNAFFRLYLADRDHAFLEIRNHADGGAEICFGGGGEHA
ncbi:cache domain-containing sensor histidine kinase [Cohnella silvisoli]|uniref:Histidine kinase n=1 Tax=Cohnella silvisoli TaxID=2873699 RepID=A0ABV1L073_9BACL|nr:sensor histidine kinase [Cohnella silvisoli]MCD9024906.1 histidine kinase [Cohnella silvisoli]